MMGDDDWTRCIVGALPALYSHFCRVALSAAFKEAIGADPSLAADVLNAMPEDVLNQKLIKAAIVPMGIVPIRR